MLLDRQQRSDALTFADLPALLHEDKAMSKQRYMSIKFNRATLELIETMIGVVGDYMRQGFTLTVRQLYYQLVARAIIPNTEQSYKRITNIVNDARIAGLMDWDAIEDRTRAFVRRQRWDSGEQILKAAEWENFRECLYDFTMKSLIGHRDMVYAFRNQIDDLLAQARKIYWTDDSQADGGEKHG
jgi:hypothetical protein